jgi:hypothetical protein
MVINTIYFAIITSNIHCYFQKENINSQVYAFKRKKYFFSFHNLVNWFIIIIIKCSFNKRKMFPITLKKKILLK